MTGTADFLDPQLFRPEAIDPETVEFLEQVKARNAAQKTPMIMQHPAAIREAQQKNRPAYQSDIVEDRTIRGLGGNLVLRTFVPESVNGVYMYFHGGGFVIGGVNLQDQRLEAIAKGANVAVISVDYRLAPEHPYPDAHDDCEAAALWLSKNAMAEFETDHLTIGGESAGANLSVPTLIRMRDKHGFTGFSGVVLSHGNFDLTHTPSVLHAKEGNLPLHPGKAHMEWCYDYFVPVERRREPDLSPLYADLSNLPPALFTVGTLDILLDDMLFMYVKWVTAGNEAELTIYPGGTHGFNSGTIGIAKQANDRIHEFIKQATR